MTARHATLGARALATRQVAKVAEIQRQTVALCDACGLAPGDLSGRSLVKYRKARLAAFSSARVAPSERNRMKLNREKFLAAAIAVSAAANGCRLKSDDSAAQISPEQQMQEQARLAQGPAVAAP